MLSYQNVLMALLISSSLALPIRREVPQEHSHEQFLRSVQKSLNIDNPDGIVDSVFGLLGNAAAAGGAGKITDATCLQQATADRAFTNAKTAGDVQGQVDALIYRALERNSGTVGGVTAPCTSIKAVNPEIAAIQQHQDPASPNAAAVNKAIVLELAKQIAVVGGDPQDALLSGTFAPGNIGDATGKGNTCDTLGDAVGCIFSQNLLVEDATAQEIDDAVAGVAAGGGGGAAAATPAAGAAATTVATGGATAIGNFGKCSVPEIEFGAGFDGRRETSFQPADKASFNHGSAQAISIITQFICDTLTNSCGADALAKKTCAAAQAAANAAPPKIGIDADIFNAAFGIATNFRNVVAIDNQGKEIAGSTGGSVNVVATGPAQAAPTKAAGATADAPPAKTGATSTAGNLQKFPGNLGGVAAPTVVASGTQFQVEGNAAFNNKTSALVRSCDVQNNKCANAANASGNKAPLTVGACNAQQAQCIQAAQSA